MTTEEMLEFIAELTQIVRKFTELGESAHVNEYLLIAVKLQERINEQQERMKACLN